MPSTWGGACGLMPRNARVRAVSATRGAGISPATILQKRQSTTGAILACYSRNRPPTYMVAWLRILGARPAIARGPREQVPPARNGVTPGPGTSQATRLDEFWGWVG